jgi:hypothetical protein
MPPQNYDERELRMVYSLQIKKLQVARAGVKYPFEVRTFLGSILRGKEEDVENDTSVLSPRVPETLSHIWLCFLYRTVTVL